MVHSSCSYTRILGAQGRIREDLVGTKCGSPSLGKGKAPSQEKNGNFRLKWRVLVNYERYFVKIWGQFALESPNPNSGDLSPVHP